MKKMSKILCSVLVMCGAFSMSAMSVYATGDILIDEPMEMEEAVTTIVSSEIIESGELPVINEDKVIEYPMPEVNVIEKNDDNEENAETTIVQDSEAPTLGLPEGNATVKFRDSWEQRCRQMWLTDSLLLFRVRTVTHSIS